MTDKRPEIPAEIRRRVLVEAGHRCEIPTCRHIEVEIHHIIPWENCKTHDNENLIALCPNCHSRAGRGEIDRKSLRIYKASLRFTHDRFSQFEVDILFEAYKLRSGEALLYPPTMVLLIKRLLDTQYVHIEKNRRGIVSSMDTQITADHLTITKKGREYIDTLGLEKEW